MRFSLVFLLIFSSLSFGQDSLYNLLDFETFMERVKTNHPIVQQSVYAKEKGGANLTQARGGFDPKLDGNISQKYFNGKQYYSYMNGGLKVPTWFGITAQGGYEINTGDYLNPSSRVPDDGLWYAGLNISLGKGLIIDERRAQLKKAKIYLESAGIEQKFILNELYLNASKAYWDWYKSYSKMKIYEDAVKNAEIRFNAIKESAFLGDKPFIDTLEAGIQLQNRKINLLEYQRDYTNKSKYLEIFLWEEGFIPLELDDNTIPINSEYFTQASIDPGIIETIDSLIANHPAMIYSQNKIDMKSVDLRLKKQSVIPAVDVKYNLISEPLGADQFSEVNISDYNWGVTMSYPLFTRKERGGIQLAQLQLEQEKLDFLTKYEQVEYKVLQALNNWQVSILQIEQFREVSNDYRVLLEAENRLFNIGESSLFLLNSREKSYIEAQLKLIDYMYENQLAKQLLHFELVTP